MLRYTLVPEWPPLAWFANCEPGGGVGVLHGKDVEIFDDWYAEAAWADDFDEGNLDRTEVVAGSGGRLRGTTVTFVGATSLLDRLHSMSHEGRVLVSNSLPCLMSAAGAHLDPAHRFYNRELSSIMHGLRKYQRFLETSAGPIQLTYYDNLVWDGRTLEVVPKPDQAPEFTTFEEYRGFLEDSLRRLAANAVAPGRRHLRYPMLATISTGYDSPAVAALAVRAGCREAISFDKGNAGEADSGAAIASSLGIDLHLVSWSAWRDVPDVEVPLLASGHPGGLVYAGAASRLSGRVLLTGYHGDKVWDLHILHTGRDVVRGDASGLGLTEYRLWAGFLHAPVAFWGARRVAEIAAISRSDAMRPWVLPDTDYNRPIPRRIVEEAGVPREWFGVAKRAAEPFLWREPAFLTPAGYRDYATWIARHRSAWFRRFRPPPWPSVRGDRLVNGAGALVAAVARGLGRTAGRLGVPPLARLASIHPRLVNLRRYWFPWAVERVIRRYAGPNS